MVIGKPGVRQRKFGIEDKRLLQARTTALQMDLRFYERLGVRLLPDWKICRLTGDALTRIASTGRQAWEM